VGGNGFRRAASSANVVKWCQHRPSFPDPNEAGSRSRTSVHERVVVWGVDAERGVSLEDSNGVCG
jgi:hypothetical protein